VLPKTGAAATTQVAATARGGSDDERAGLTATIRLNVLMSTNSGSFNTATDQANRLGRNNSTVRPKSAGIRPNATRAFRYSSSTARTENATLTRWSPYGASPTRT